MGSCRNMFSIFVYIAALKPMLLHVSLTLSSLDIILIVFSLTEQL